jgi:Transcriptional regulator containing an amidase domain and an AraC-type DNA-binding HTH domain
MSISAEQPAMKLITQYLHSFSTVAESSDADVRDAFGMHLSDLLMLIVGTDRDTLELIKGRGLKAARTDVVLRLIAREYASPNLSADRIGLTLGITARQVHRLLEETTKTFYEHLLERRLLEARRLLTDPSCGVLPVAEIAQRTGFVDRTHFNHTFRTRFGETPTDAREAAVRENARRFSAPHPIGLDSSLLAETVRALRTAPRCHSAQEPKGAAALASAQLTVAESDIEVAGRDSRSHPKNLS